MAYITRLPVRADTAAESPGLQPPSGAGHPGGGLAALVTSSGNVGSTTIHCPFDDSAIGELPLSSDDDVDEAFRVARAAQRDWAARPMSARAAVFRRFAELVLEERSALLDLIQRETGKARFSAFEEVADVSRWASYAAHKGPQHLREGRRNGAFPVLTRSTERFVPQGVVGIITPWNYPFTLPAGDAIPALLAGNAVVLKPDSQTPHTALFALELLRRAGLPEDLMQIVVGPGSRIGPAMIERADFMMFTGSTATGRSVAEGCASQLIGFSAELGGKNPMLVLADADVHRATAGAVNACFSNSGQLCISIERIYVHRDIWDDFVPAFLERVRAMRLAPGLGWDPDMGSLIGAAQLETVAAHVDNAITQGATVLAGGRPRPDLGPYFYEPTVLADVRPGMPVAREETFGPVVSLYRVDSEEEAIGAANDSEYGLNASVWSRRRGTAVARRLEAGTVNINEGYAAAWASHDSPMGGMKASGVGRRHGAEGFRKYTEPQTIAAQRLVPVGGQLGLGHRRWSEWLTAGVRILNRFS
ncbi:succinate-semialdehyde dehydrogenase (NADP(+)) [Micrococcaceae bacterium RIT802]|nr:succinate-semialdehyde dehydrogenase (NADP(+)) [Micrococcaceae bacterium RIT 802]